MESPDTIHGRMKEGAHLAGYSLQRTMENLRWLLEDGRYQELSNGYSNVNDFLRDTANAFSLLRIDPTDRKEIAQLVKEAEPQASQRAIADMVGVTHTTIGEDLGTIDKYRGVKTPPATPPQDYSVVEQIRKERERQEKKDKQRQEVKEQREKLREAGKSIHDNSQFRLIHGDFYNEMSALKSNSIDIIITDPPYNKGFIPELERLSKRASEVLMPGGSLVVMFGQSYLPDVYRLLSTHLDYHWTIAYRTPGGQSPNTSYKKVNSFWKPLLWFVKGKYNGKWLGDVAESKVNDNDKRLHQWGQSESGMADIIKRFTDEEQLILDPFMGSGTTGIVAIQLGRRFVGIDNNKKNVEIAAGRIAEWNNTN